MCGTHDPTVSTRKVRRRAAGDGLNHQINLHANGENRMTKFINRVDHVAWISSFDNIEKNVQHLSHLFEVEFQGPKHVNDLGFSVYLCWEGGLEIIAPHAERTEFNKPMHDHLANNGEGPYAFVFGVPDLAKKKKWLEENGYSPSEIWGDAENTPWAEKIVMRELDGGFHLRTQIIFSEIDYSDGVVTIEP